MSSVDYNMLISTLESTVVTEYVKEDMPVYTYQSEADLEREFIKNLQNQVKTFQQKVAENEARKQLLQYQVDELDEFNLRPNEYLELEDEQRRCHTRQHLHAPAAGDPSISTERARRATSGQTALHTDRDHQARKNHRS